MIEDNFKGNDFQGVFHKSDNPTGRLAVLLSEQQGTLYADL